MVSPCIPSWHSMHNPPASASPRAKMIGVNPIPKFLFSIFSRTVIPTQQPLSSFQRLHCHYRSITSSLRWEGRKLRLSGASKRFTQQKQHGQKFRVRTDFIFLIPVIKCFFLNILRNQVKAGEMAHWLKAHVQQAWCLNSVPGDHIKSQMWCMQL